MGAVILAGEAWHGGPYGQDSGCDGDRHYHSGHHKTAKKATTITPSPWSSPYLVTRTEPQPTAGNYSEVLWSGSRLPW